MQLSTLTRLDTLVVTCGSHLDLQPCTALKQITALHLNHTYWWEEFAGDTLMQLTGLQCLVSFVCKRVWRGSCRPAV